MKKNISNRAIVRELANEIAALRREGKSWDNVKEFIENKTGRKINFLSQHVCAVEKERAKKAGLSEEARALVEQFAKHKKTQGPVVQEPQQGVAKMAELSEDALALLERFKPLDKTPEQIVPRKSNMAIGRELASEIAAFRRDGKTWGFINDFVEQRSGRRINYLPQLFSKVMAQAMKSKMKINAAEIVGATAKEFFLESHINLLLLENAELHEENRLLKAQLDGEKRVPSFVGIPVKDDSSLFGQTCVIQQEQWQLRVSGLLAKIASDLGPAFRQ